jgi:hypothetical protein
MTYQDNFYFDILGVPVGTPDAVEHIAQIYLDEILAKILSKERVFAQDALLLLQHCVLTKATHMLRYGAIPSRILAHFDCHLKLKVITRFSLDEATEGRWLRSSSAMGRSWNRFFRGASSCGSCWCDLWISGER